MLSNLLKAASGKPPRYIAVAHSFSPMFTLLDHTTPGSVSLAATYTTAGSGSSNGVAFSPDGDYIAVVLSTSSLTLLDHTTPGSVSLAATYSLAGTGYGVAFSPDGDYIAVAHGSSPRFTLLDHTTPGSVSLAATYSVTGVGTGFGVAFSPA
jgi:WD40 repeat protein